ncbi:PadR family transcriptional regulator [Streptococcus sobrinus]|uniref:PadR family transcriptional regulator n=1 Tax=Streptococcus sobrinus TaxID=1310 RepID=UPI0002E74834|nr:PadR family transcriptional regulator [Streptococcus sobrinus]
MSIKTSLTEELILGLLAEQPRHGYQIEKLIEDRGMRRWAEVGFSSIYYVLDKLEKKELAKSAPAKGKEKKEYAITDLGLTVLTEKTKQRLLERQPANSHFMTALANSQNMSPKDLLQAFKARKKILEEDLQVLKLQETGEQYAPRSAQQLFSLGITMLQAELGWLEEEIDILQSREG